MNRKDFIRTCGLTCIAATGVMVFLEGCASAAYYAQATAEGRQITIRKSEFVKVDNEKTTERKYVLVRHESLGYPICIYKLSETEYSALLMQCTHNSCELDPQGSYLVCPCHGSSFSNKGEVQNPPAEQNLRSFETRTDNENIYVQL
jgi:cytochrome b6-f complex iron-sulfur subunit